MPKRKKHNLTFQLIFKIMSFLSLGNGTIVYRLLIDIIIKPKCSDSGGIQGVTGAGTSGRDWDSEKMKES
jgi:hypothetical protein